MKDFIGWAGWSEESGFIGDDPIEPVVATDYVLIKATDGQTIYARQSGEE
jgi:hypothetical protein